MGGPCRRRSANAVCLRTCLPGGCAHAGAAPGSWTLSAGKDSGWRCRSDAQRCVHRCVARRAQASDILSEPPVLPGGEPAAAPPDWRTELSDLAATLRQDAVRSRGGSQRLCKLRGLVAPAAQGASVPHWRQPSVQGGCADELPEDELGLERAYLVTPGGPGQGLCHNTHTQGACRLTRRAVARRACRSRGSATASL